MMPAADTMTRGNALTSPVTVTVTLFATRCCDCKNNHFERLAPDLHSSHGAPHR